MEITTIIEEHQQHAGAGREAPSAHREAAHRAGGRFGLESATGDHLARSHPT